MPKDDRIRLRHMLDAAREAVSFTEARSRADLDSDRMLVLSLVKSIEIVGEAASRVTAETQRQNPEIPWQDIVGMRNRLIHAYYDIDLDRVWDTVLDDLPPLITSLQRLTAG
jgi:uncharacterized protein with HEPN domain